MMPILFNKILIIHLIFTSAMVGIIWLIQLVHYPSFLFIDKQKYSSFQNFHMQRISFIVMPVMLIELFSGLFILFKLYVPSSQVLSSFYSNENYFYFSLLSLILIWIFTGLVFTKIHTALLVNFNEQRIKYLMAYNWIRTILWSARLILLIFFYF